ncbi:ABC transporter ATP-binding protein [Streptomyces albus]|uniref:ATP-binding cassette domain-containing protein n=1 Tax=Streptomyces albus TaxID=1888 RepID=A0A8H1LCF8_9ACTN|nr:ABC transporter ATP-binding protein [Streptomyces albus]TGG83254.1 ATP-binding cassette domain-containing protein [Streptomyces albus]UVN57004.1 ATP-binding cassette domain-containing protein [Streptomyces albus]GHJ21753.1 putative ABC transporter ATP-binding protein [Streptomyces albus]
MISFDQVSVVYDETAAPALPPVDAHIPEGELCLLIGPSGVGKSTLLGTVSGLVPHFTGGTLHGRVTVAGRDTRTHKPRELADVVGTVGQDPLAHFVTDTVEDELAYGMESLGLAPATMRRRVEETLDLLGLNELRDRPIASLSGGQQQRVAIGSVLTPHPRVLVLDEPTSALDPPAAEEVLAVVQRLVHDLGTTVLMAEHRLERVVQYADRVLLLTPDGGARLGDPAALLAVSPVRPPVVELGQLAGWDPLPLSVRDARRRATGLRDRLAARLPSSPVPAQVPPPSQEPQPSQESQPPQAPAQAPPPSQAPASASQTPPPSPVPRARTGRKPSGVRSRRGRTEAAEDAGAQVRDKSAGRTGAAVPSSSGSLVEVSRLTLVRGRVTALHEVDLSVRAGETVALMGRNGAGKSTLLNTLVGLHRPTSGRVTVAGKVPHRTRPAQLLRHAGLVPQEPRDLLYADTVARECRAADADAGAEPGSCRALVSRLLPDIPDTAHPRDLSEGQRLTLALAVILTAKPPVLLLDEPTRGLDYAAKSRLVTVLRELSEAGHALMLATHDVELVAEIADRVVVLAQGEPVADGPTHEVVTSSPAYAPQVSKILAPQPWLTVGQVREAL